jgi:exodeoxyribonuclease-3
VSSVFLWTSVLNPFSVPSESQGEESQPIYYLWHHKNRPYHIDYVFLPQPCAAQIQRVDLGSHATYSKLSDHVPSPSK